MHTHSHARPNKYSRIHHQKMYGFLLQFFPCQSISVLSSVASSPPFRPHPRLRWRSNMWRQAWWVHVLCSRHCPFWIQLYSHHNPVSLARAPTSAQILVTNTRHYRHYFTITIVISTTNYYHHHIRITSEHFNHQSDFCPKFNKKAFVNSCRSCGTLTA